ncbi:MAG: carbohydrate binding domain-containing protein [Tannerellaceae bacterium]|nr:carbohydrate binding domain-containing protein [Tannerellaceae bacterium]
MYLYIKPYLFIVLMVLLAGCMPEMPVTSTITIEGDGLSVPVNKDLYGLTIEEINHAVEGGIYGELIRNRSFEDGVLPLHSRYDASRNLLITPNGWTLPFVPSDSVPGWHKISSHTYLYPDNRELMHTKTKRSLFVSVTATPQMERGGVVAEGYKGIPLQKGERYRLSFFIKGATIAPKHIHVTLEDPAVQTVVSDTYIASTQYEWKKQEYVFTAKENIQDAVLTFSSDSSVMFWLDMVSLFPEKTWKGRSNGLRPELMEKIADLTPKFIRFPGGAFVEGYTNGTFPVWHETVGDLSERRHFWNIWGYGTTNGMGYHEYLQMCEDLQAEPVYVVNSGVTSQSRRPRYEDITAMPQLVKEALNAIAYANEPADSTYGSMRAKHGHPEPFHLKYIEIGSENYGYEYARRFRLFKKAIQETYPDITVISSGHLNHLLRTDWVDHHFYANEYFFMTNHDRFEKFYPRRTPSVFIGELATANQETAGTQQAAVAEAAFYIAAERSPDAVKRVAYAPVLGNANYEYQKFPFIFFDNRRIVLTPSYHAYRMFSNYRGDELLRTEVETYRKPAVTFGCAAIEMFDNSYEIEDVAINNQPVETVSVRSGGWKVNDRKLIPDANRWNDVLIGDSTAYNYEFSARIRRTKGSGPIQFHIRDNGRRGDQAAFIGMSLGGENSELYQRAGAVQDSLVAPLPYSFESHRWYTVRMSCYNDVIRCYVDGSLIHEVVLPPLPSLVSVATFDQQNQMIFLKVVNTTQHEERTELVINGVTVRNHASAIELFASPEDRNTFEYPEKVTPQEREVTFPMGRAMIYTFPPNSITLLKLEVN